MTVDFRGTLMLVTGGTRGLGKAIGKELARSGARVVLTHRWGSVDEADLHDEFRQAGLAAPEVIESDVSDPDATRALMLRLRDMPARLTGIISNVAFAKTVGGIDDLKRGSLELSLRYSTWPIVELPRASRQVLGHYPRYVIAISTDGGMVCHPGYDMAGVAKAALETLCRYLALRLRPEGVRVNALRPGFVDTASARAMFGDAVLDAPVPRQEDLMLDPQAVGRACVALCSGLMDGVTGQVIAVDDGASLISPISYLTGAGWPGRPPARDKDVDP
jgi:NAD(P)-dependent dehydrogenase (short-subunit alcohol dehydrogenase family)